VQSARDAFFTNSFFVEKGIWDKNLFDGRMDTLFNHDPAWGEKPRHGGALRVDFGARISIDRLMLRGHALLLPKEAVARLQAEVSADLRSWRPAEISVETDRITAAISDGRPVRYFRMNAVPAPLAEIEGYQGRTALNRAKWRASNLFASYAKTPMIAAWSLSCKLDEVPAGSYLAIPLPGRHKAEGAFAAVRVGGQLAGAPSRAVSYNANVWEAPVETTEGNYTYYVPVTSDMRGKQMDVVVLVNADGVNEIRPEAWITAYPIPLESKELVLSRDE
jgi:hypothetical protein